MNYVANIARNEGDPKILSSGPSSLIAADRVARALGWFSVALGVVQILAPRAMARRLGMQGREGLLRAFGARELGTGILSLSTEKQAGMLARVAGDGLDLAALLGAYRPQNPRRGNVGLAIGLVAAMAMLDLATAQTTASGHARRRNEWRSYSDRSGFPRGVQAAHGAAGASQTAAKEEAPRPASARF